MTEGPQHEKRPSSNAFKFVTRVGEYDVWMNTTNNGMWRYGVYSVDDWTYFDAYADRAQPSIGSDALQAMIVMLGEGPV